MNASKHYAYQYFWYNICCKRSMNHIIGKNRQQVNMSTLEDFITPENPVRFIDAFVDKLDLNELQFKVMTMKTEGRPAFESKLYLKIYLYGYLNGIRSSRRFEKECMRNRELQWLTNDLQPNYHSIADFRKNNPIALRNAFKLFVLFMRDMDMVCGTTVAIDGTKVRANNSKKNNYNPKKIERHIQYIEEKTNEYLQQIEKADSEEDQVKVSHITEKIERLKNSKLKYELLQEHLDKSGEPQVSTTDADARALLVQGQVVEVSYNMQAAVDSKHKLIVATHTINRNDRNALANIAKEAKENTGKENMTVILDKGYHNGRQIQECNDAGITTIVAPSEVVNSNEKGTTPAYMVTKFIYNSEEDTYTCPQGSTLKTTGTWHKKTRERDSYNFKKYRTPDCKNCPVKHLCTGKATGGREIERSQYAQAVEENNTRYKNNTALYRTRQEINEHIFGTIKRQWGYNHTNLRGLLKVNGEHSLICLVYNIKRVINILGIEELMKKLKNWKPNYKGITFFCIKKAYFKPFYEHSIFYQKLAA